RRSGRPRGTITITRCPNRMMHYGVKSLLPALFFVAAIAAAGCGPSVDLSRALEIDDVATGWTDGGRGAGKLKVVPVVSLKLKNVSPEMLRTLQVNAGFRRAGDEAEWGSAYLAAARAGGLAAGQASETLRLKARNGYTGSESHAAMLAH